MKRILLALVVCLVSFSAMATNYYSGSTGNLNLTSSWWTKANGTGSHPSGFTASNQIFIIRNSASSTISANWTVSGTGSKIMVGNDTVTCNFTIPSGLSVTGTVDVTNNATLTISGTANPTLGALKTGSTVKYNVSAGGQSVVSATYYNLNLANSSGTQTAAGTITVNGALTTTSGGTFALSTFQLLGTLTSITNNGTITTSCTVNPAIPASKNWSAAGQVTFGATTGNQFISAGTYKNLTCSNTSDTNTAVGNINITGTFTTSAAGGLLNMGANTLSGSAATITNNGTILTQNTSSAPLPTGKSWAGTVNYNGTGNQTIMAGTYASLVLSGARGISTITLENGTIAVSGSFNNTATGIDAYAAGTNTFVYSATAGGQAIGGITYNNLTLSNTSGINTASGNITVNGTLTTTSGGTFALSAYQLTGASTVTNNGTITTSCTANPALPSGKSWSGTTGQVTFGATTGNQFIPAGTYKGLTCSNTSDTNVVVGNINVTSTFVTSAAGGLLNMGTNTLSGSAAAITNNGTILTQNTSSASLPTGKSWAGTVNYNGTGNQTIMAGTYVNLALSGTRSSSTITLENGTISVSGSFSNTAAGISAYSPGTNTFVYSAAAGGQKIGGITYNNLTLSNTTGSDTATGNVTVNGVLTTTSGGTFALTTYQLAGTPTTVTNNGTIITFCTANPALPSGKSWSGTTGQVTFAATAGNQFIPGGTYKNITCSNTSDTNVVVGTMSVTGTFITSAAGGTLDMGTNALSSSGTITNSGTILTQNTSSTPLPAGKSWAGTVNYNGTASQTIMAGTYASLALSGARGTSTITLQNGTIAVSGSFNNTATGIDGYSTGTNTFVYSATAGGQAIGGITYNNLTLSNTSGTNTATGDITVNGALVTTSGGTLALSAYQLSGTPTTVTNNGTITTLCTANPALPAGKSWIGTKGIVTFASVTGGQYIPGGTFKTLTCSNTSDTNRVAGPLTMTGAFTTSAAGGTLDMGSNALSVTTGSITNTGTLLTQNTSSTPLPSGLTWAGTVVYNGSDDQTMVTGVFKNLGLSGDRITTPTITLASGTISLSGSFSTSYTGDVVFSNSGNTFTYTGNTSQTVGGIGYNNLSLTNTGSTKTAGGNISVAGTLTTTSGGKLAMDVFQLTGAGAIVNNGTITTNCTSNPALPVGKSWGGTTGLITFAATTGGQYIPSGTYKTLTCSNTSDTNLVVGGDINVTGTFTTAGSNGVLDMGTNALTATTITNNGTILTQNNSSTPLPSGRSWANTVNYNGSGDQTIVAGTYVSLALTGDRISTPAITLASGNIALSGSFTVAYTGDVSFVNTGNTFTYTGNSNQTVGGISYNNLTLTNTSLTKTAGGDISVSGALTTASGGTLAMSAYQLSGALTAVTNNGTISTLSTANPAMPAGKNWSGTTGLVTFGAATGGQFIPAGTYKTLTCSNTSDTNAAAGNIKVTGTITTSSAGGALNMGTYELSATTITNNSTSKLLTQCLSATPFPSGLSLSGTVYYNAPAGGQTIVTGTYKNLSLTDTSGIDTATGDLVVNAALTTNGGMLDMGIYALSGSSLSPSGAGTIRTANTSVAPIKTGKNWPQLIVYDNPAGGQTIVNATYSGGLTNSNTSGTNTVASGATLTVNGDLTLSDSSELDDNNTSIAVNGDILGGGAHLVSSSGRITVNTSASISGATFGNLRLNSSGGFSLTGDATVNGTLTLSAGTLMLGDNNLIMGLNAPDIAGTLSSSKMIVTNGTGQLRKILDANNTFLFPIGDTSGNYTPITLVVTGTTYGDDAYVAASVVNAHHPADASATNYLKRYWSVATSNIIIPSYSVSGAKYVESDVVGDESNITVAQYTGSLPWIKYDAVNGASDIITVNGLTSNSDITGIPTVVPSVFVLPFSTSICNGGNVVLNATGDGVPPLTYSWSPATGLSATTGASVTAAPTTIGTVSATYVYTVTITDGNGNTSTAISNVIAMPLPPEITGSNQLCKDAATTLSNAVSSGNWTSDDESIATIDNNGEVTGIEIGNTTITYASSGGCIRTFNLTVNPLPAMNDITGSDEVCESAVIALSNDTPDGVWSSGAEDIATVNGTTGEVSGVSGGPATISYTVTNLSGCSSSVTHDITVNALPQASIIAGGASVCVASSITLFDSTVNGFWISADTSLAKIDTIGNLTGFGGAWGDTSVNVFYVAVNDCGNDTALKVIAVKALPTTGTISAANNHRGCPGQQWLYTSTHTDGNWSTSDNSVATIDSTGLLTVIDEGSVNVSYTVIGSNGCSKSRLTGLTVNPLPLVSPIDGVDDICPGNTLTITNASTIGSHTWTSGNTAVATISSGTGVVTGIASGTVVVSYNYTIGGCTSSATAVVTVNPSAPPVIAGENSLCVGSAITLTADSVGGTWYTTDMDINVDSAAGIVTGINSGTAIVTYTFTNSFGCTDIVTRMLTINAQPSVATIGGGSSVCAGSMITLTESTVGGSWSSADTDIAVIGTSGVVTGIDAGAVLISYTVTNGNGCSKSTTKIVTINALPVVADINAGTGAVCRGSVAALTNASGGSHIWSSDNAAVAAINSSTGALTAVATGTATISYKYISTCVNYATAVITVNPVTAASVSGTSVICAGTSVAFGGAPADGVWSGSSASRAAVGSLSGIVTGMASGPVNITYTYTNSYGCASKAYMPVTINPQPSVGSVGGATSACVGASITFTDGTVGGVWSSSNTSVGTIGSATGAISALSAGTTVMSYTVTGVNGCSKSAIKILTVNALPAVANINAGSGMICRGAALPLTDSTTGSHLWTSANLAVATINSSTGVVTGIAPGTVIISYRYTLVCNNYAQTIITVNPAVTPTITGTAAVCAGSATTLNGTPADGVWVSGSVTRATVNTSGVVTAIASGTSLLTYTYTNEYGCAVKATRAVTINALPSVSSISGSSSLCQNVFITLTDATSGGVWSSANTGAATVADGVVTGVGAGTTSISYTVTNVNGCVKAVAKTITVNPLPSVAPVSAGSGSVNEGSTIALTDPSAGTHVWSSANTSVATVNASTGVVTGVDAGTVIISYAYTSGCTNYATTVITVNQVVGGKTDDAPIAAAVAIQVYPNPTAGSFNINAETGGHVLLYSLEGKQVAQFDITAGSNALSFPGGIAAGAYMCMFSGDNGGKAVVRILYQP